MIGHLEGILPVSTHEEHTPKQNGAQSKFAQKTGKNQDRFKSKFDESILTTTFLSELFQ